MSGFPHPWYIAGGWAIDLFLGRTTRDHPDVDIALFREDQLPLRSFFDGWELKQAVNHELVPWPEGERLELPIHEIHATRGAERLEFLLNERDGDWWRFRRDLRVGRPVAAVACRTRHGTPYLAPEVVLLYKSNDRRESNQRDLAAAVPAMPEEARRWLRDALPFNHPWIAALY